MEICQLIDSLLQYGINKKLIKEDDYYYSLNALLDIFNLFDYSFNKSNQELSLDEILDQGRDYANYLANRKLSKVYNKVGLGRKR